MKIFRSRCRRCRRKITDSQRRLNAGLCGNCLDSAMRGIARDIIRKRES